MHAYISKNFKTGEIVNTLHFLIRFRSLGTMALVYLADLLLHAYLLFLPPIM